MESEISKMTLYKKDDIIYEISKLLEYYNESENKKAIIKAAHLLIDKVRYTDMDVITLEPDFIEEILFILNKDGTKTIAKDVYLRLRALGVDLKGVSFDNVHISGFYFNGLKNVEINIQKIPNCDISGTLLTGVKLIGTLNGANIERTNFTDYIGDLTLNPQLVQNKNLYRTQLKGITVNGSFEGVSVTYMGTRGFKGEIVINPQKVADKDISGIDFNGVKLIGDYDEVNGLYADPCFDGCKIHGCSFKGCIGKSVISLDRINYAIACNFTGVMLTGKTYSDKLFASYYEDDNGNKIYLTNPKDSSKVFYADEIKLDTEREKQVTSKKKSRILTFFDRFKRTN